MILRLTFLSVFLLLCNALGLAQSFQDAPDTGTDGEAPVKWDLIRGSAHVGTLSGSKAITLENNSIISPKMGRADYLPDSFELEFEAYFAAVPRLSGLIYYQVRFWGGTANSSSYDNEYGAGTYLPIQLYRNRAQTVSRDQVEGSRTYSGRKSELEDIAEVWRSISISYNKPNLQVSIDGIRILDIPNYKYDPKMVSVECRGNEASDPSRIYAFRKVLISGETSGSRDTYTRALPEEDRSRGLIPLSDDREAVDSTSISATAEGSGTSGYAGVGTGLEALNEGNGIGWRLKGRDPSSFGNIGENAVDLSYNATTSEDHGATGRSSLSFGTSAKSAGSQSIALGALSLADGANSTAIGQTATAMEEGSIAIGVNMKAMNEYSTALGFQSWASGNFATVIGNDARATAEKAFAIGSSVTASGQQSTAMGFRSTASGNESIAIGNRVEASSDNSLVIGSESSAYQLALALGRNAQAEGVGSHAIGSNAKASGWGSTAIGNGVASSGTYSFSAGFNAEAQGDYSTALGSSVKTQASYSTAIGMHNIGGGDSTDRIETDPLFEVGNGTSGSAANALTILKNGNMGITTHEPVTKLHITGGTDASLEGGTGYVVYGDERNTNLVFDNNEILARNNGNPSTLHFQNSGGDVHIGGALAHSSDQRLKRNINDMAYGLDEILRLNPKTYFWKNRDEDQVSLGLVAQDVQPILGELVRTGDDENQTLSLNYTGLIPVLINALKEQQAIIDDQKDKIENLTANSEDKDRVLDRLSSRLSLIESVVNSSSL